MKKLILLFCCSILLTSCYTAERNCADFKTGTFVFEQEIEGKKQRSEFSRTEKYQIEEFNGAIDTFDIRWINDCEYVLKNIKPKNRAEKKVVHMKILTTDEKGYIFEYSFVGETQKQRGTVFKLEN